MDNDKFEAALQLASDTRHVLIGKGTLEAVPATFNQAFGDTPAVIVADTNTYAAAGEAVDRQLRGAGIEVLTPVIFPGQPALYADFDNVLELGQQLANLNAIPIAVGSGTINDITKLAAYRVARPYMVVATAASMDGYTAFGAAITKDGFKQTMSCPAPRALIADLEVLAGAPSRMNSTGYGDLLGKITAGADWLVADALEIEPISPPAWELVQASLRKWTGEPKKLHQGDPTAISNLLEGLVMSGVAMQISQSSRPASGSEHRFSHLWEMQAHSYGEPDIPHGFKVGIGSLATAALYELVLEYDFNSLDIDSICQKWSSAAQVEQQVRQSFDIPVLAEKSVQESLVKYISAGQLRQRLMLLKERWPQLRDRLKTQLMTANQLRALLETAGCPTDPTEIGIDLARLKASYDLARQIRRRYTLLDLLFETNLLQECVNKLFAPSGYWGPYPIKAGSKDG
jgi:glycerol-1-phosphate dehydrogenase [NAD(P)+]